MREDTKSELQKALLENIEGHARHGKNHIDAVNLGFADFFIAILDDVERIQELNNSKMLAKKAMKNEHIDEIMDELLSIGNLICNQSNRLTDQPMFIVQQKKIIWGMDSSYSDMYKWSESDSGDYCEADDHKIIELENLDENFESTDPWSKVYYCEQWVFVTACFTEKGCKDYIKRDGHNLNEPRIYADGSYRNKEFRDVRNFLANDIQHFKNSIKN